MSETSSPKSKFIRQYYRSVYGHILMPVIVISLATSKRRTIQITTECLLDSGSDHSIFSFEIADELGLRYKNASIETGVGFGGRFRFASFPGTVFLGTVSDSSLTHSFEMHPRFHEPGGDAPQVLGRLDFFNAFEHIEIFESGKYVDLYPA